jgi:TonB-dependent starch-binding outer membrane protein SusC
MLANNKTAKCSLFQRICKSGLIILFFIPVLSTAQVKVDIKGYVKDIDGNPISGVSISKRNTEKGVTTDQDGFFNLKSNDSTITIVASHVGYATKQVKTDGKKEIIIILERTAATQEEVVVIGYGTSKKKDLTGAVATIKPKETDAQQFNTVDNLLKGRVAGVQVQQSAGDPGGAISVKIRGINSLRGDNEPLYVVDGVIINNSTNDAPDPFGTKTVNSGQSRQTGLAGINPLDIETIDILKDASATAIYGSRGANGVVIITTKQGKGKPIIRYLTFVEASTASKKLKMLDAKGYANYINEYEASQLRPALYKLDTLVDINWQDEMQRTGLSTNNRLSITGSSADNKSKYFIAAGFLNNQGIVRKSYYKQGDLKLNFSQELTPKLKLNFTLSTVLANNSANQSTESLGGGDNSMIMKMLVAKPIANAQTALTDPNVPYDNPYTWLEDVDDFSEEKRILVGLGLTYKISKSLFYRFNIAADYKNKERKRWFGKRTFNGKNVNGQLGLSGYEKKFYQIENLLNFNTKIKNNQNIDATIGVTYDNDLTTTSSVINEGFFSEALRSNGFGFGQILYPYYRDPLPSEVFAVLGRVSYSYKNKYLATISARADGSSKFATGNKFSYFPAVALAWKIGEEDFLKNSNLISNMKIRAGYGKSGNQAISPYNTFARYGQNFYVSGNTLVSGAVSENIPNQNLRWETTSQFNVGIDAGFLRNKFTFTVDWYYKKTGPLLQSFALPTSSGYRSIEKNIGEVENKGLEFTVTGILMEKRNFSWSASANISFNRNKILDLGLDNADIGIYKNVEYYIGSGISTGTYFKDPANIFMVGQPIGTFYGYRTVGIWQTSDIIAGKKQFGNPVQYGDIKFVDQNADGDVGAIDKVILGNPNPKFTYGFNSGFTLKNLSLDLFFNGSYGNQIVNGNLMRIGNANGLANNNILADTYYNAWTSTKSSNTSPRVGYNNLNFIDQYVEDASFIRLATATLGYNFSFVKSKIIKSIGVNITGKNLFTFTNYTGFDPEVNSFAFDKSKIGVDWGSYPNLKSVSLGVNITF